MPAATQAPAAPKAEAPKAEAPKAAQPPAQAKVVEVLMWHDLAVDHPESKAKETIIADFNAAQSRFKVVHEYPSDIGTKLPAAAAAGTPPDFLLPSTFQWFTTLMGTDFLIDIEDYLKKYSDWATLKAAAFPGHLAEAYWKGKMKGVPFYMSNFAMFYNKTILTKKGIAEPDPKWNLAQFREVARKVAEPPNLYAIDFRKGGRGSTGYWWSWAQCYGVQFLSEDRTKVLVNNEQSVAITQYLADLILKDKSMKLGWDKEPLFWTQNSAFDSIGPFRIPVFKERKIDFGVVPMPREKQPGGFNEGYWSYAFKRKEAERVEGAVEAIHYVLTPEANGKLVRLASTLPVYKTTMESKEYAQYQKDNPFLPAFIEGAQGGGRPMPNLPSFRDMSQIFGDILVEIFEGKKELVSGLNEAVKVIQPLVDKDMAAAK